MYYGEREGSDTVLIPKSQVTIGDVFLITVHCRNECKYDLRSYYTPEIDITNANRKVKRWGGHSTAVLKFDIPRFSLEGVTEAIDIRIEPEGDYKYLEAYISFGE